MKITDADLDTFFYGIYLSRVSKRKVYKSAVQTKFEVEVLDSVNFGQCRAFVNFEVTQGTQ